MNNMTKDSDPWQDAIAWIVYSSGICKLGEREISLRETFFDFDSVERHRSHNSDKRGLTVTVVPVFTCPQITTEHYGPVPLGAVTETSDSELEILKDKAYEMLDRNSRGRNIYVNANILIDLVAYAKGYKRLAAFIVDQERTI